MKEYGHLAIPLVFLIYMLFFSGKTVIMAAFYTILFTIVVAQLRPNTRMSLNDIIDAMVASAKSTVSVAIACACVGIIVGVCSITGFALNMASTIIQIGGQSLMFTLMFTMVTCMILEMCIRDRAGRSGNTPEPLKGKGRPAGGQQPGVCPRHSHNGTDVCQC